MRFAALGLCVAVAIGPLLACSDSERNLTAETGGWLLTVSVDGFPSGDPEFPVSLQFKAQLVSLVSGTESPDGTVVIFSASGGTFANGLEEISMTTTDGVAEATLQVDLPGSYQVSVRVDDLESRMSFSV